MTEENKNNIEKAIAMVIVDISHEKVDRGFEYKVPENLRDSIEVGMEVKVPFGKGNKLRKAYVIALKEKPEFPYELKEIQEINKKAISMESKVMQLAYWMKKQYGSTMITCLQTVLPVKKKVKEAVYKYVECLATEEQLDQEIAACNPVRHAARLKLLKELKNVSSLPVSMITGKLGISSTVISTLEKRGMIRIIVERSFRGPKVQKNRAARQFELSGEQRTAIEGISRDITEERFAVSLLHGITGSGKTEVYMDLIDKVIAKGKQAIVLIPEISLTYQTLLRFYGRFGDRVGVMNSRLSDGERYDQYERALKGELDIMIGPRSALFTPFLNLGIIVIDEEHENSYKSEKMPKYDAREVAEYLAKRENAVLVLGSATPSLESYYKAQMGEYHLYKMNNRNGGARLPNVYCVDLREELKKKNTSYFSEKLKELLTECMMRGQQAMLFINRRGFAGFVSCRNCGYVVKCEHCNVSLTQHQSHKGPDGANAKMVPGGDSMVCHYCGYQVPMVTTCPKCGSKYIAGFRAGTEKIEQELKKLYPSIRVLRMDADTTKNKDDYENILSAFSNHEADVLVGTQMIVKGHDFPNVTLVGIIAADLSLFSADYRSAERTFQLVVQAAGRAGRGSQRGNVVVQSYQPEHYSLQHAIRQDYEGFYEEEILYRTLAGYPPVNHMLAVQLFATQEERGEELVVRLAQEVKNAFSDQSLTLIGPGPAVLSKIKDVYRMVFYVKAVQYETLTAVKDVLEKVADGLLTSQENMQFDFDPKGIF